MAAFSLHGPNLTGDWGPKSATNGIPEAAAKCIMPLSLPMNSAQRFKRAMVTLRGHLPTKSTQSGPKRVRSGSNSSFSRGEPRTPTRTPCSRRRTASRAKSSRGQPRCGVAAKGWSSTNFSSGATPSRTSSSSAERPSSKVIQDSR